MGRSPLAGVLARHVRSIVEDDEFVSRGVHRHRRWLSKKHSHVPAKELRSMTGLRMSDGLRPS